MYKRQSIPTASAASAATMARINPGLISNIGDDAKGDPPDRLGDFGDFGDPGIVGGGPIALRPMDLCSRLHLFSS